VIRSCLDYIAFAGILALLYAVLAFDCLLDDACAAQFGLL
jgi:hypothetical protein